MPFRLPSDLGERPSAEAEVEVDARRMVGLNVGSVTGAKRGELFSRAEAGTMRSVFGWILFDAGGGASAAARVFDLGSPRAAAAKDCKVERLARRAASWSAAALWFGESMLKGEC